MKTCFTVTIQSAKMQELSKYTEVFNVAEIPDIICVKLPDSMPRDLDLSGIYCLDTNTDVEFEGSVTRNEHRPWIDISKDILDIKAGQHVYRLTFSKEDVSLTATCWFSYIVQDNFVDKPYIYMKREDSEEENA